MLQYIEQLKLWLRFHSYNSESLGGRTFFFTSISRKISLPINLFFKSHLCPFPTRLPKCWVGGWGRGVIDLMNQVVLHRMLVLLDQGDGEESKEFAKCTQNFSEELS